MIKLENNSNPPDVTVIDNKIENYNKLLMALNNSLTYLPYAYIDETKLMQMRIPISSSTQSKYLKNMTK